VNRKRLKQKGTPRATVANVGGSIAKKVRNMQYQDQNGLNAGKSPCSTLHTGREKGGGLAKKGCRAKNNTG